MVGFYIKCNTGLKWVKLSNNISTGREAGSEKAN